MSDVAAAGLAGRLAPERVVSHRSSFGLAGCSYAPVVAQWILLGLRYGDMSLPTAANPSIETGGLCGESKTAILDQVTGPARDWIAPYTTFIAGADDRRLPRKPAGLIGQWCSSPTSAANGTGVRLVPSADVLRDAVADFPRGVKLLLQRYVPGPGEAGLFYIRYPDEAHGRLTSITLKVQPSVMGDGRSTLEQLVRADPRAGRVPQVYLRRLAARLAEVPAAGEVVPRCLVHRQSLQGLGVPQRCRRRHPRR